MVEIKDNYQNPNSLKIRTESIPKILSLYLFLSWQQIPSERLIFYHTGRSIKQVKVYIAEQLPLFKLDFGLMEQVIYTLLINVTQHTPEDTQITIQAESIKDCLILTIADNGKGFPENEIDNVFNKFTV